MLGSATTLRNMCSSSSAPGSGPRQGSCKVTEDMEGSVGGEGGGLLSVIAERGNIEARERAEKLLDLIRASPRGSTGLSAQAREAAVAAAQDEDASQGAALPTVFFGSGNSRDGVIEVELLKVGEKPGQGLQSELPEVLRHQCVPGTLSGDVLVRACAGKKKPGGRTSLAVVDCTAGYLHDSLRLAAAGHRVTAIERDPVVFSFSSACLSMLQHSHNTSKMFEERVASGGGELSLLCADSAAWLSARADESAAFDIVYLDPMFPPKRRQSALPKRRMQVAIPAQDSPMRDEMA